MLVSKVAVSLLSLISGSRAFAITPRFNAIRGGSSKLQMSTTAVEGKPLQEISAAYKELYETLQSITQLKRVSAVLDYDRMVLMPSSEDAAAARGAQQAVLASIIHEKSTDVKIASLISQAWKDIEASSEEEYKEERRILALTQKSFDKNNKIPAELEAKRAKLQSAAYSAWVKARTASDFSLFESTLKECFDTAKEVAECTRADESIPLYTQMLDEFETGMSASRIDDIFSDIETALVPLIQKVLSSSSPPSTDVLNGEFPIDVQKKINEEIVTQMGFDLEHGRVDESVHPFTMSFGLSDVRITSRYSSSEWYQGLAASIHEAGHAMYEQNVKDSGLEIDSYLSMGTHESQSLFWERHIGMSKEFCKVIADKMNASMPNAQMSCESIYGAINSVSKSEIRVEADELTYPLHVILRYNIERDVVEGTLDVKDIPSKWNELMKKNFDIDIKDDAKGCLQDVHWSGLAIGYFPTYLIGAICSSQLAYYCEKDLPSFRADIENNDFGKIKAWLVEKVHKHGRRYESLDAMLEDQLGEKLNPKYFIDYLTNKYCDLYKV